MDPKLVEAAISGDVNFLKRKTQEVCEEANKGYYSYFLSQHKPRKSSKEARGNIFHLAGLNGQKEFFNEAMQSLPNPLVHQLLSQPELKTGWNPLHVAAGEGHLEIVRLFFDFYRSETNFEPKPWLALDRTGSTALHVGLSKGRNECALEILSFDMKELCNMVDKIGNSPLLLAVKNGCKGVALHILTSAYSYSLGGKGHFNVFHFLTSSSENEEVFERLIERHPESIKEVDYSVLHHWTRKDNLWPLEYVLKSKDGVAIASELKRHFVNLIYATNKYGNNSFHVAAKDQKVKAAITLANVYREERAKESEEVDHHHQLPWLEYNEEKRKLTPLCIVMDHYKHNDKEAHGEYFRLTTEIIDMKPITCEILFLAIDNGLIKAASRIWDIQQEYGWSVYPPGGREIWRTASKYSEKVAAWFVEKFPDLISEEVAEETLLEACKVGKEWFVKLMLKKHPDALGKISQAWLEACKRGHLSTVVAFIDNCPYFRQNCLNSMKPHFTTYI